MMLVSTVTTTMMMIIMFTVTIAMMIMSTMAIAMMMFHFFHNFTIHLVTTSITFFILLQNYEKAFATWLQKPLLPKI